MSKTIHTYLFSTDENFTEFPTMTDRFIEEFGNLVDGDHEFVSIVTYLTDEAAAKDELNFKPYIENIRMHDDENESVIFVHANANDSSIMYALDVFTQFVGLGPIGDVAAFYGKNGDIIFTANTISHRGNELMNEEFRTIRGWTGSNDVTFDDRPALFDLIVDYSKYLLQNNQNTLPTNPDYGAVYTITILTGNIDEDDPEYKRIERIRHLLSIRFEDTGTEFPRLITRVIRYEDLPNMIDDIFTTEYVCAFMWATPNVDNLGLTLEESKECVNMINDHYDKINCRGGLECIRRKKPNGDSVMILGTMRAFLGRIDESNILMSDIMNTYFGDRV